MGFIVLVAFAFIDGRDVFGDCVVFFVWRFSDVVGDFFVFSDGDYYGSFFGFSCVEGSDDVADEGVLLAERLW